MVASWFAHPRPRRGGLLGLLQMTTALLVDALTSASFDGMPRPVVTANPFAPSLALAAWWPLLRGRREPG